MRTFHSLSRAAAASFIGLAFVAAVAPSLRADDSDATKAQIEENKADQQQVRAQTAAVMGGIQDLINELTANKISGPDIQILRATQAALNHLSGAEMSQVIACLQKAGEATSTTATEQNAVNAYAGQKGIILQFGQILKEYEERQAAYELPVRFKELVDRQTETMLTTADVARSTAGKPVNELTSMQQTTEQIVQSDQDLIAGQLAAAQQQLDKAVQNSSGDDAKPMQNAQKQLATGKIQKELDQAAADLKAGMLLKAVGEQKAARDDLQQVAQALDPAANAVDALTAAAADLAKLIDDQKKVLDQTNTSAQSQSQLLTARSQQKNLAPLAKADPDSQAATDLKKILDEISTFMAGITPNLDTNEAALVDTADSIQRTMQTTDATSAGLVKEAIDPMQMSRRDLGVGNNFAQAATEETDAIAKLEEAQKQLQAQVAAAQAAADAANKDPVAQLQDVQQKIQQAMQQQQQITQQTAQQQAQQAQQQAQQNDQQQTQPPDQQNSQQQAATTPPDPNSPQGQLQQQQAQLQQQTAALQQQAQPLSLDASQALANAANQMNQAQQAMNNPAQAAQAQADQQAAQAALAQANQQVAAQIAQAQQQPATPDALAQAANALQQAQTDVSTAIAAPAPAGAAQALQQAQQQAQAAAQTPGLPGGAAQAIQAAQQAIGKGQQAAAQQDGKGADAQANAAQQDLAQAQAAVAMAQAGMMAGGPPDGGPPGSGPPDGNGPPMPGTGPPDPNASIAATDVGAGDNTKGKLHGAGGQGKFVALASRDRASLEQTQAESRPQEYSSQIDQYMKNLADQSSSSP